MKKREADNLELDTKRALQLGYGVRYGRYKADYPNTKDYEPFKKIPIAYCIGCGAEFVKNRKDRTYCSDDCRCQHYKRKENRVLNKKRMRLENCQLCGKPIEDRKMRRYCSIECSEIVRYKRIDEYRLKQKRRKDDEQAMGEQFGSQGPDGV